jgi:hypothetical protein
VRDTECELAGFLLEKEYWPEWNERFARPLQGVTDLHRLLTPEIDLASSLSHVESRVIDNNYPIPFVGRKYRIARKDVRAGMKRQNLRVELRLDGMLKGRYEGRPVELIECLEEVAAPQGSQCRRQEPLDGGLLGPPRAADLAGH